MAGGGTPVAAVRLTDEERETLLRWPRRVKSSQQVPDRVGGASSQDVATALGIWPQTVGKWRRRFLDKRLVGLVDEPRPGAPRTITDEQIENVVVATLERQPTDGRNALISGLDSRRDQPVEVHRRTDLEGVRPQAAPGRHLQTVH